MKSIDFLPDIYRQRETLRQARVWWGIVALLFGSAIGSSVLAQVWLRHSLYQQLDDLAPQFSAAQAQVRELADLQIQIAKAADEASLFTYLDHPWPRTQLLSDIVRSLPTTIRLTQLHIGEEELPRMANQATTRRPTAPEASSPSKLTPAQQDLQRLMEETDQRQTVIVLDGDTTDVAALHQYVAAVNSSPLIAAINIKSLETPSNELKADTHFTLRLIVRPGYGQRGNEGPPTALTVAAAPLGAAK